MICLGLLYLWCEKNTLILLQYIYLKFSSGFKLVTNVFRTIRLAVKMYKDIICLITSYSHFSLNSLLDNKQTKDSERETNVWVVSLYCASGSTRIWFVFICKLYSHWISVQPIVIISYLSLRLLSSSSSSSSSSSGFCWDFSEWSVWCSSINKKYTTAPVMPPSNGPNTGIHHQWSAVLERIIRKHEVNHYDYASHR